MITKSNNSADHDLALWSRLIYERAKDHLYRSNQHEKNISNWVFPADLLLSQNECIDFSTAYEQKYPNGLLSGKDFYPPGIALWVRMDKTGRQKINDLYKHHCYQVSLIKLSETGQLIAQLIVSVTDKNQHRTFTKKGFISTKQSYVDLKL